MKYNIQVVVTSEQGTLVTEFVANDAAESLSFEDNFEEVVLKIKEFIHSTTNVGLFLNIELLEYILETGSMNFGTNGYLVNIIAGEQQ